MTSINSLVQLESLDTSARLTMFQLESFLAYADSYVHLREDANSGQMVSLIPRIIAFVSLVSSTRLSTNEGIRIPSVGQIRAYFTRTRTLRFRTRDDYSLQLFEIKRVRRAAWFRGFSPLACARLNCNERNSRGA